MTEILNREQDDPQTNLDDAPHEVAIARTRRRWAPRKRSILINVIRIAIVVALLILWQKGSGDPRKRSVLIDEFYVSKPSDIGTDIRNWYNDGILWPSLVATLKETVYGFVVGAFLGLVVGMILGINRFLGDIFSPFVTALNSTPRLALVPLFILWFGLGTTSKVALVITITFFLVFYATFAGVRDVDEHLVDVLRVMGARPWHIYLKVTLQSAMSWIVAGFRTSIPYALVAAVTAEMIASNKGMGYLIVRSSGEFNTSGVFAGIAVLIVLGLVLNYGITVLERFLLRWKPERLRGN